MYESLRTRGEQYTISITKNGDDITPGKGVIECDQLIEDIIGISYELFTKTIIFSGNATPFLALPIAQQRSQIEELFNITMLSEKAKLLKEKLKQTELDLKVQEAVMKQQELAIELHSQHTTEAEKRVSRWETERTEHILMIKSSLAVIGTVDFELEQLLHDEKNQLQTEGAYLAAKLAPIKKDHQILSRDLEKELGEQAHLMEAKCPYCLQKFADAAKKLAELSTKIDSKSTRLLQLDEDMKLFSDQIKAQATRLGEVQASIQHPNLKELLRIRENASVMQSKIDELEAAGNPHIEALERLKTETQVSVDTEKVDTLRRRLEHQQFLLKLLTNKDSFLRRRIINKTIPFLNSHINAYTASLGLPHIVKFDADLSCTVSEFGRELDFGNLSAGEKKRVNVGLALAFRDVLHHLHAKCNILLVDELDGALDVSGMDSVVRVFKDKARDEDMGIYVISHHPSIAGRLDKMLTIQKVHGFSQIIES
jgi:hypothetical protein